MESILILIAAPVLIYLTLRLAWWWMGARARAGENRMFGPGSEYRKRKQAEIQWIDPEDWARDLAMRAYRNATIKAWLEGEIDTAERNRRLRVGPPGSSQGT